MTDDQASGNRLQASQPSQDPWTVLRLLQWTTDFFRNRGSQSARLDAEVLLAHARSCSRIELYTDFEQEPDEKQRTAFRELVRRRGEGTPVAQLVGYKEFYSLRFRVNEHTLIPRPETEHLVIEAIDFVKQPPSDDRPLLIADVGTGSGAIAIALAVHCQQAQITATDLSPQALEVATWNATQHAVNDQIDFVNTDLLSDVEQPLQFDLICSNPPYVSESEYEQLDRSVREFEPKSALVAGEQGTEIIERLIELSDSRLCPGGRLIVELSPMIVNRCVDLVEQTDFLDQPKLIKDLSGLHRVLSVQRK